MIKSITLFILFAFSAIIIPFYFNELEIIITENTGMGWVTTSILIRIIVIMAFTVALKFFFSAFEKTKGLKTWIILLIGIILGFLISFTIAPIYNTDYGIFNDGVKLENIESINTATDGSFSNEKQFTVIAFFTTNCPFCKSACRKLSQSNKAGQNLKVDLIFPGTREDTDRFLQENEGTQFNSHTISDEATFMEYSGSNFPSIFLINPNGETQYHWIGDQMNYSALDYLLSLEQ
ncbi:MAG: redoxin domain-containing protein [Crocinitomix sp.]|nr:redoxin domain-containing protein [Crocinitomix sp.]